jgi:uncharacterized membrane protein YraQ (UPF0718 family)
MIIQFLDVFWGYLIEVLPALAVGFILSGLIHEFVPIDWVERHLGGRGIRPIAYLTIVGTFLPLCCVGALPVGISFYKKGARLGPVLAFLVATPATSATALLVSYRILGSGFTAHLFFSVILMGLTMGIVGNSLKLKPNLLNSETCPRCAHAQTVCRCGAATGQRVRAAFRFAFVDMPKEIGLELLLGLVLAAGVSVATPVQRIISTYLTGGLGYLFGLVFGLIMYICSTGSVPLVDALLSQGMNAGAGVVVLLAGPITSYATILVLRKEFGWRILLTYVAGISFLSLILGYVFHLIR